MENNEKKCFKFSRIAAGVLGASLIGNLFLLGMSCAPILHGHKDIPPPPPPPGLAHMIERIEHDLSSTDAATVREFSKTVDPVMDAAHNERDVAFAHLADVLRADTLNNAELQKALTAVSDAHGKMDTTMSAFIKEIAGKLTPAGRRVLADKGLPPPHGKDGHPPMGQPHTEAPPPPPDVMMQPSPQPHSDGVPLSEPAPAPDEGKPMDVTAPTAVPTDAPPPAEEPVHKP